MEQRLSHSLIVLDDLEIESKREVAASAGLIGETETGSRFELQHQVRYIFPLEPARNYFILTFRCDIKWIFLKDMTIRLSRTMFLQHNLLANIASP